MNWSFDGQPLFEPDEDIDQYRGPIEERGLNPYAEYCIGLYPENLWASSWRYSLGKLETGEYQVSFDMWFHHPITELTDIDGDGSVDIISDVLVERSTIIKVVAHIE